MDPRNYYLQADVDVWNNGSVEDESLMANTAEYKRFCEDLLTYIHTLEKRIAVLEHRL